MHLDTLKQIAARVKCDPPLLKPILRYIMVESWVRWAMDASRAPVEKVTILTFWARSVRELVWACERSPWKSLDFGSNQIVHCSYVPNGSLQIDRHGKLHANNDMRAPIQNVEATVRRNKWSERFADKHIKISVSLCPTPFGTAATAHHQQKLIGLCLLSTAFQLYSSQFYHELAIVMRAALLGRKRL
jgi:hypothetical protein